ncbi:hypothetical protein NCCP133_37490 [Cytobacillus sp. NCCP-133]|nr:hypothetical protein NCCP133_37490 [Cytobacillus sp. NCCP-133]
MFLIVLVCGNDGPDHFDEYQTSQASPFYITNNEGCSYQAMFEKYLLKHGIQHFQTMELWSIEAIKKVVMSGPGF